MVFNLPVAGEQATYLYRIFDRQLASTIALPELPLAGSGEADMRFELLPVPPAAQGELHWFHHWRDRKGNIIVSCAHAGDGYCLRFHQLADFWVSANCRNISAHPVSAIPRETIRHLLLDQVMPRVMAHRGHAVIHGSANRVEDHAVLFIGDSGAGKSTLAASLHRRGFPLLCDDCLCLQVNKDDVLAVPGYAGARLWPDSAEAVFMGELSSTPMAHYSKKQRLTLPEEHSVLRHQLPVKAIFLLDCCTPGDVAADISIRQLSGASLVVEMLKNAFQLDMSDREKVSDQFAGLGRVVASEVRFFSLKYPREHALIERVHEAVLSVL